MKTTTFAAGITSRMCALPMLSTAVLPSAVHTWRDRVDASPSNHNSIATAPAGFASVKAGVVYGAAKQAAPPRGIPR